MLTHFDYSTITTVQNISIYQSYVALKSYSSYFLGVESNWREKTNSKTFALLLLSRKRKKRGKREGEREGTQHIPRCLEGEFTAK